MLDLAKQHITLSKHCGIKLTPKYHLWLHLCLRILGLGKPFHKIVFTLKLKSMECHMGPSGPQHHHGWRNRFQFCVT